ncbi:DNA primase [Bacillus phage G]|uniref:Gp419 n=1 Tax=Bacillus phage G TaxID=2884420 RepID=G3MAG0_9CAUD|nr:DNA primase [Bacillus phage G]AEO93677.1 gp419 [Bacillus phage G]
MENNFDLENEYYKWALKHPIIGEPGRRYLQSRGINEETIEYWSIGYAPIGHKKYTKLRGRITFPVFDNNGKIVTISGRSVFDTLKPKYDMYPFSARKILFGLWQNRHDIRDHNRAIITEGQIDVITSWQNGLKIVTSTFGAHGTLWHLGSLARYAKRLDILYDNDSAGKEGEEGIKNLPTLGDLDVKFNGTIFPKGTDLDNWIQKHSPEELFTLLDQNKMLSLREKLRRMGERIK